MAFLRVPQFTWEYKNQAVKDTCSKYKRVHFNLDGNYKLGTGMSKEEHYEFYNLLTFQLVNKGFKLDKYNSDEGCPSIIPSRVFEKTQLYLHPMEFDGYLDDVEIQKVKETLDFLKDLDVIHDWELSKEKEVSDLTPSTYRQLLIENTSNIADWLEKLEATGTSMHQAGSLFANHFRIPRVGDKVGLYSLDMDYSFVNELYEIKQALEDRAKENDTLER